MKSKLAAEVAAEDKSQEEFFDGDSMSQPQQPQEEFPAFMTEMLQRIDAAAARRELEKEERDQQRLNNLRDELRGEIDNALNKNRSVHGNTVSA